MSTSWQWFPETKEAICNYCGFTATYQVDFPGHLEHDCDSTKHPALTARQGLPIGRSPRPEAATSLPLDKLLACIHRGPEVRQEPCETCGGGVRIKLFACGIHRECQLDDRLSGILESRGSSPRNYKNTLVFLAGDTNRLRELAQAVRQYLAWSSIWHDRVTLNLDQHQSKQAETSKTNADEAVDLRISESYSWLLVPAQPDPKGAIQWTDLRAQGSNGLAGRAAKKLKGEEAFLVEMGGIRLRTELDRIPLWTGNHVSIKQLCEYMARYLYLPRLRDDQVLVAAIQDGVSSLVWKDTFAYAESWDEQRQRYLGLKAGSQIRVIVDDRSVLVKPEAAAAQIEADQAAEATKTGVIAGEPRTSMSGGAPAVAPPGSATAPQPSPTEAPRPRRFHGSVLVDPMRLGRDASRIAEEVVQHLTGMVGSNVEITIEIQADLADGASEKLVRDVTENCRTLRFTDYGFEES